MIESDHQELKVFWFFFSKKNKDSSFSEEKEAKRLLVLVLRDENTKAGSVRLWVAVPGSFRAGAEAEPKVLPVLFFAEKEI